MPKLRSASTSSGRRLPGRVLLVLGVAVPFGATAAAAQEPGPLVTDRPDQTESTAIVPPGFVQLELGWTMSEASDDASEIRTHTLPEALARIGVVRGLELRIGLPAWSSVETEGTEADPRADGFGDASLGLKWSLAEGRGPVPAVALLAGATLPTGEEGLGSDRVDPSILVALSSDLGHRLSIGWNLGWARTTEELPGPEGDALVRDTQSDLVYSAAAGIALTDRLGLFLEGFGFVGVEEARPSRHSLDGGFTFLVTDNLQLDVRAGLGLDEHAEDAFLGTGLSLRLPR